MAYSVKRESYGVVYKEEAAFKDTYGGEPGSVFIECMRISPEDHASDQVVVFSHPIGGGSFLPIMSTLARAGMHVVFVNTRYRGNDSALIMEKCLLDLGAGIADAKRRFNYTSVVLGGWSGGGSLSLFYQEQAQSPTIESTPAGDPLNLKSADLPKADAIMLIAAHVSRSVTLTEWMDASINNELDPSDRNVDLDLYNPTNPNRAPFTQAYLARYRQAQIDRNRKITDWVRATLAQRIAEEGPGAEQGFVVHGTMADPRWLDSSVDPNDRVPGTCYLGDPRTVNMGPVGLARFCTLRSWLSQWSFDASNAHGEHNAANVRCPVLVIGNLADNACTPSHTHRLFKAVGHADKELHQIEGATHYYAGQPEKCAEAAAICGNWLKARF
ncbi:MAG: alpha/beta fold hydrolase [Proteobacteria bacterium]|nr:alpha/beta fold hydrolase [Pseudomonadota bacterium]